MQEILEIRSYSYISQILVHKHFCEDLLIFLFSLLLKTKSKHLFIYKLKTPSRVINSSSGILLILYYFF